MNKTWAVLLLLLVSAIAEAGVYGFIEPRTTMSQTEGVRDTYEEVYGFFEVGNDTYGVFVFGQTNTDSDDETFQQAYAGPYWRPAGGIEIGVGYGREWFDDENGEKVAFDRFGSYIDISRDFGYLALAFEDSEGSGYYYEHRLGYTPNEWLGIGGIWFQHLGPGPRIEFKFPLGNTVLNLWGAYLYGDVEKDQPENTTIISVQLEFEP